MRGKSDPLFVFVNLLTHSDQHGIVDRHWRAIADETGLSQERITKAIEFLESPDHESRTPDEEGRRIVRIDTHRAWGWRIVNHTKYRDLCTKTQNAERQARFRKSNAIITHSNGEVTPSHILPVGVGVGVVDPVLDKGVKGEKVEKYDDSKFVEFWKAYPNKKSKEAAFKAFKALSKKGVLPENEEIIPLVELWAKSEDWTKDDGKWVPHAATWLNGRKWQDGIPKVSTKAQQQKPATFLQATDEDIAHMERKKRDAEVKR